VVNNPLRRLYFLGRAMAWGEPFNSLGSPSVERRPEKELVPQMPQIFGVNFSGGEFTM